MKNVIIFHWTLSTPNSFWFHYIKKSLSKDRYNVLIPQLPNADNPDLSLWLPFVLKEFQYNKDTILIGHSAGCPLILSILENIDVAVSKAILVAWFCKPINNYNSPILQKNYNWTKIKNNSKFFVFINSKNDPWWCNDKQGMIMFNNLWWDLIIRSDQGHMGSDKYNQPYKEFPLLKSLVEN